MSEKRRQIRKAKATPGESAANARERARREAEQAARRRRERRILVGVAVGILALVLIAGVSVQLWRSKSSPEATGASGGDVGFAAETVEQGRPVRLGKPDAKVTFTVYSDFLCPHCQDFEEAFGPTLKQNQDAGLLTIENVPMSFIAPQSAALTNAYGCAIQQGAGQAYSSALFANTSLQWTDQQLVDLGTTVKPDMPEDFATCVTRKKNQPWVDSMNDYAAQHDVSSTPTLFLDGKKVELQGLTPQSLDQQIKDAAAA